MRIAIYHNILWSKYKGIVFSELSTQGASQGIDVSFIQIAETEEGRVALGGVDLSYHRYPFRLLFRGAYAGASLARRILALSKDIVKYPADVIIIPGYHRIEYWAMLIVCLILRRKRAVFCDSTAHDNVYTLWKGIAKRIFFRFCDGFFCYGIRSKDYLLSYGASEAKIIVRCQAAALPHGYDAQHVLESYTENNCLGDATRFIYVGRLSAEKGLLDLLEAFAILHSVGLEAQLDFVGAGPCKEDLIKRTSELGLENSVTFLGAKSIDEIALLYATSTALVLPSHSEPWGLVVNEALAYGCPVVVSSVCGCVPELVMDGVTGFSFKVGDVKALSLAMAAASKMSVNRATVAKNCLNVISTFTPAHAATQILNGCISIVHQQL